MADAPLEFRLINYANTKEPGGAKLYRGDVWIGTVWRYVCGWSWCLVVHPAKIGGGCDDFESGCRALVEAFWQYDESQRSAA